MKNIPMFTTENGVASLILQEIPYRREAYVHIRCTAAPELLFRECFDFCKMAGAEKIYFTGHPLLETRYPFHTSVLRLRRGPCRKTGRAAACSRSNGRRWKNSGKFITAGWRQLIMRPP